MKKVGPTPLFLFSPFHRASLFDEGVSSAKTNRCSVREPRRGRKNSRRATRKRLLKRELCKRESVFFILPTSVLLYRAFRVFYHAKEIDAFHPSPNFLNFPVSARGRAPPSQKRHRPTRVFFLCSGPKKSPVCAAILFSPNGIP